MRSMHLKILAILSIALLSGLVFFVFESGSSESDRGYEVLGADSTEKAALERGPLGEITDADRSGTDRGGARQPLLTAPTDEGGEAGAQSAQDLSLRGRLVNESGTPVEGARVLVESDKGWVRLPLGVEEVAGLRGWRTVEETVSDEEGRFAFTELDSSTYVIEVQGSEHARLRVEGSVYRASAGLDVGDLVLVPGAVLRGRVLDERGQGVAGAQVLESMGHPGTSGQTLIPGRGRPVGETDSNGGFRLANLPIGDLHLIVDSAQHLPTEVAATAVEHGQVERELVVRLESGFPLEGRVEGVASERNTRIRVTARLRSTNESNSLGEPPSPVATRPRTVACNAAGQFRIEGLADGKRYRLTAFEVGDDEDETLERLPEIDPVYARPGDSQVVLGVKEAASLRFRVVDDATSRMVTSFVASAGFEELQPLKEQGKIKREHPEGSAYFENLRRTGDAVTGMLEIRALGYEPLNQTELELKLGEELDLGELRLTSAPRLVVQVKDAATGKPVADAYVVTGRADWLNGMESRAENQVDGEPFIEEELSGAAVDENGRAELPPLRGKASLVVVAAEGYATFQSSEQNFTGDADVSLTASLVRGGEVVVQVRDPLGRAVVGVNVLPYRFRDHAHDNEWVQIAPEWKTDSNGTVRFEHLRAGEHGFRVHDSSDGMPQNYANFAPDQDWTRVVVADGETHELELSTPSRSSLRGTLRELGVPLANAELTIVPVVNGEPVEDEQYGRFWGGSDQDSNRTRSDEHGLFAFDDVEAGEYLVRISHPMRYMTTEVSVDIPIDPFEKDFDLGVTSIEGRVTNLEGMPLEGLALRANTESGARSNNWMPGGMQLGEDEEGSTTFSMSSAPSSLGRSALETDSDGRYVIRGVRPEETITVSISDPLHSVAKREVAALAAEEIRRDVDFVLEQAGAIHLRVAQLPEGTDRVRVLIEYLEEGEHMGEKRKQSLRSWNPRTQLNSLLPGLWKVELRHENETVLRSFDTHVLAGETTELEIELQ